MNTLKPRFLYICTPPQIYLSIKNNPNPYHIHIDLDNVFIHYVCMWDSRWDGDGEEIRGVRGVVGSCGWELWLVVLRMEWGCVLMVGR